MEEVVRQIFAQFREVSRKKLLESVKTNDAARIQKKVKKIQKDLEAKQKELDDLKAETILVIRGVSALDKELLGTLVAEAREALETLEKQLVQAQEEYEEATKTVRIRLQGSEPDTVCQSFLGKNENLPGRHSYWSGPAHEATAHWADCLPCLRQGRAVRIPLGPKASV